MAQKTTCVTSLSRLHDLPCTNSVQTNNWAKISKILLQRHYDPQTASDNLKTMTKRKRITSSLQKLRRIFDKQDLKNQSLEEPPNGNLVDSTRGVTLTETLDAEDMPMETKKFLYSVEREIDTGLLVVPRTITLPPLQLPM